MDFTFDDLRSGDVVEFRDHERYVIFIDDTREVLIRGIGCREGSTWADFRNWNDDMTHPTFRDLDIMKVLRTTKLHSAPWGASDSMMDVVFDREAPKELTVAEISQLLGYKVKVIEG